MKLVDYWDSAPITAALQKIEADKAAAMETDASEEEEEGGK